MLLEEVMLLRSFDPFDISLAALTLWTSNVEGRKIAMRTKTSKEVPRVAMAETNLLPSELSWIDGQRLALNGTYKNKITMGRWCTWGSKNSNKFWRWLERVVRLGRHKTNLTFECINDHSTVFIFDTLDEAAASVWIWEEKCEEWIT